MSRILVLRALGLGDLLVAVPALRALRAAFPSARITLAAPESLRELTGLIGAVDELLPTEGLGELSWPHPPPWLAVNLHGSGPESVDDLRATEPERLFSHGDGPQWIDDVHETERWCGLLEYYGIPAPRDDLELPRPATPSPAPGAIVVHPGAAYPARRWPPHRFAAVARVLADAGNRVIVTGGSSERVLAESVAEGAGLPEDAVVAGRTSLGELAALVADAALVVCGDTGVGHLATAYGTPSVLLFGPTPPRRWGPPPGRPRHTVLWAGSVGDPFGDAPDPGLLRITPSDVLSAAGGVFR